MPTKSVQDAINAMEDQPNQTPAQLRARVKALEAALKSAEERVLSAESILDEFVDLCPRVDEYEPMAGALSDACRKANSFLSTRYSALPTVRAALRGAK